VLAVHQPKILAYTLRKRFQQVTGHAEWRMSARRSSAGPRGWVMSGTAIIVTGAAGGIGAATAARLAAGGALLTAVGIDAAKLADVVAALPGGPHRPYAAYLTNLATHEEIVNAAVMGSGRLAGLAHLAAVLRRAQSIYDISEEEWDAQLNVNLKATFFLNRAVARFLVVQGTGGAIVNFTSQAWWTGGFGGNVAYATSKGGVVSMSRNLARTLAPWHKGQHDCTGLCRDRDDAGRPRPARGRELPADDPAWPDGQPRGDRWSGIVRARSRFLLHHRRHTKCERRPAHVLRSA
jgi:NADP-dependent 3-hydroxy acid dehydrogenase YdfG